MVLFVCYGVYNENISSFAPSFLLFSQKTVMYQVAQQFASWKNGHLGVFFSMKPIQNHVSRLLIIVNPVFPENTVYMPSHNGSVKSFL